VCRTLEPRPGGDAQLVKDADEPAVAAVFAGELPWKQPRRGRVGCGGHVAAAAQVLPQQGGNGLGHVEPVRAELEPGGAVGAGGVGGAQRGDSAGLLAVEHNKAADEAVTGREGLIQQQPPDRSEPGVRSRRAGLHPVSADHRDGDVADDALLTGPGQEGDDVPPGGGPGGEPLVEIVLGAVTELPSAAVQPGQERDRHGKALFGPLVGAVAKRRRGTAAGSQVAQQAPLEEPFEQPAVPGGADAVELGSGPALEAGQAPVAGRQDTVTDQQAAQVFDGAARPEGIQGGVAAGDAVPGQVPQGLARDRAAAQPQDAALRAAHGHQPVGQRPQAAGHLSAGPGKGIGDQLGQDAPPAAPPLTGRDLAPAAAAEAGGDAAAAGAGRLPAGVQTWQRGEGAAAGAAAGAQPGLQVAVLADPSLRPVTGAAGVALAAARTGREPGRIGLASARPRHAGTLFLVEDAGPFWPRAGLELHHRRGGLARGLAAGGGLGVGVDQVGGGAVQDVA
jgi:hypothetical protein